MRPDALLMFFSLTACSPATEPASSSAEDQDGDSFTSDEDCDDADAAVHPDAEEVCDGTDNDCDGLTDDDALDAGLWYPDDDSDGYSGWQDGDSGAVSSCEQPDGHVAVTGDCDDAAAAVHPDAGEVCDGIDNDCDGLIDDDDDSLDPDTADTFYADDDGDGYGAEEVHLCGLIEGASAMGGDCDDAEASAYPGAEEVWYDGIDADCIGDDDYDADADGHQSSSFGGTDCDDDDASIHPEAEEVWYDGIDADCDGNDADADGDGFDAAEHGGADCDDSAHGISPEAGEVCDGIDNDCDGLIDDDDDSLDPDTADTFYADDDSDGYGDSADSRTACARPGGYIEEGIAWDCDDGDAAYHPWAAEDDCTDPNDYNCDGSTGYDDADGDDVVACEDCSDASAIVYPGADEVCDGVQNDCDAGWTSDAGLATFFDDEGSISDWSTMSGGEAITSPGELWVCEGTWSVNLTVEADDVSILGAGSEHTILDGDGAGPVITASSISGLDIQSVTITNGSGGGKYSFGGGVYLDSASATLSDATISGNASDYGGGLYLGSSHAALTDCTVADNSASYEGGGVWLSELNEVLLTRTAVSGNTADDGGGIYVYGGEVELDSSTVSGNTADDGGGMFLYFGRATLGASSVSDNTAYGDGGGLHMGYKYSQVSLDSSAVSNNTAGAIGGGIYVAWSSLSVTGSVLSYNTAGTGGGIYSSSATVTAETCDLIGNADADVYNDYNSTSYRWGLEASFTCSTASCY